MLMSDSICQPEPVDHDKVMLAHAIEAYSKAKRLQEEFIDIRNGLPPAIQIPAQRLSLRVSRYRHRIRIRWYYCDRKGKSHALVRLCCYKTKSGRPYIKFVSRPLDLHIAGAEADLLQMIHFEERVWSHINHSEDVGDICTKRKIFLHLTDT
jgi:hypothetical protein